MTKILNIISDSNIGGAGRVLLNYLRYADTDQFETHVALPQGSLLIPLLEESCAIVHPVAGLNDRSFHPQDVKTLKNLMRELAPDLVHTHGALSGRVAAKGCHIPVIFSRHSVFPVSPKLKYPPGRWANRFLNHHYADHIIAVSPAAKENLTQAGVSPDRITVIMNGVAPLSPASPQAVSEFNAKWGVQPGDFVLGILARIEDYKGHLHIVEAAELLKSQGRAVKIFVAGTGPFSQTLTQAVAEKKLEDRVILMGFQSEISTILSALDVQLNASYGTEATSIALLEGMSLALPSIVSDYGGNPYLIQDGETGLIFPSRDSAALAAAIAKLMDNPPLTAQLGRQAAEKFNSQYTGSVFAQNTEAVYLDVLKGVK